MKRSAALKRETFKKFVIESNFRQEAMGAITTDERKERNQDTLWELEVNGPKWVFERVDALALELHMARCADLEKAESEK